MFLPQYPLHVVLILTNRCNLRCVHCSSAAGAPARGELRYEELRELIEDLAVLGVVDVAFSGGEPLMHPRVFDLARQASLRGMRVGLSTNGAPLTDRRARALFDAGVARLQVSIDGPREVHDVIRGAGSFARALAAVARGVGAGLRTQVCFTAMRCNHTHLADVVDIAASAGARAFNLSQFVATGRGELAQDLRPDEMRALIDAWTLARARHPSLSFSAHLSGLAAAGVPEADAPGFIGCHAGVYIACVTATGDVLPCVMFPLALGNLRRERFEEIWARSPVVADLRARVLRGACGGCSFSERCGGCRAAAYVRTGDYTADDPRCWLLSPTDASPQREREATHRRLLPTIDA